MPWYCSICTDLFNNTKVISTTQCGHIYHLECLRTWTKESGTCPECRQSVAPSRLVKLHPNEISGKEKENNESYFDLKTELSEKDEEIRKLKSENDSLVVYVAKAESEASAYFQEKCKLEFQIKSLSLQKNFVKSLESKIAELEKINRQLHFENEHLNGVKTIVNGTQTEAEEVLSSYSTNLGEENAAKKLATYCSILKRELDRVIQEKKVLKSELLQLKNQCSNKNFNLAQLQSVIEKLKKDISRLENEKRNSSNFNCSADLSIVDSDKDVSVKDLKANNDVDYSPITVKFSENQKKIGVRIVEDEIPTSSKSSVFGNKKVELSSSVTLTGQEDSITRVGYDGLGGHGSVINKTLSRLLPKQPIGKKKKSGFSHSKSLAPMSKRKRSM